MSVECDICGDLCEDGSVLKKRAYRALAIEDVPKFWDDFGDELANATLRRIRNMRDSEMVYVCPFCRDTYYDTRYQP